MLGKRGVTDINNFHVYDKVQLKTETYEKDTRTRNRQSATKNIRCGELGSTRQATKNTRCGEWGTTRQATKNSRCGSDDICSLGGVEHSPWRATTDRSANRPLFSLQNPNFDNPNPKIDRKHYLMLFYNLDITFLH